MLGMALPVFRTITGSRSEAGASNIIQSVLARARTDAIGLDKPMGVAFMYNPNNQQSYMAEVEFADCPAWTASPTQTQNVNPLGYVSAYNSANGYTYYYVNPGPGAVTLISGPPTPPSESPASGLIPVGGPPIELRNDTELLPLPAGIGVQTICNCNFNGNPPQRISNGYLSFGVILFDGNGRVVSQNYGVSQFSKLMTTSQVVTNYPFTNVPIYTGNQFGVASQYGLVVYQQAGYLNQRSPTQPEALYIDATPASPLTPLPDYTSGTPSQQTEENWLDQNATPLLINRYTGTLIRGD